MRNKKGWKMRSKEIESIKEKIVGILKENGVRKAGIFGSYARGEAKKDSDVDILVEIDENLNLFEIIGMKLRLEELLKKKVDLVEYHMLKKRIRKNALREEVRIL